MLSLLLNLVCETLLGLSHNGTGGKKDDNE
jgi:hypothetical protein